MSFDEIGALQRKQLLDQQSAIHSNKLILKKTNDKFCIIVEIVGLVLMIPTLSLSLWICLVLYFIHMRHRVYVKNIATGEEFYLSKEDWKIYKSKNKQNKKTVDLSDLENK